MYRLEMENGYYLFKLKDLLTKKHISINKLCRDTNTDFKVIKRIMTGNLVKLDIFVLARFCDYLNCPLNDLVQYLPNKK